MSGALALVATGLAVVAFVFAVAWLRLRARLAVERQRLDKAREALGALQQSFARFAPAEIVEDVIARGVAPRGDVREVAVLFADIAGFTSMSDRLAPEVVVRILNDYFERMSQAIATEHGHVSKFIGDGIMALFGAVEPNPWLARDAVRAALGMRAALKELNLALREQRLPELKIGIGVHVGEVVAGIIGSSHLMEFTVIGDVVNVASRVESLTRKHGTDILITDEVREKLGPSAIVRAMPPTAVKGKPAPIVTWAVDGLALAGATPAVDAVASPRPESAETVDD